MYSRRRMADRRQIQRKKRLGILLFVALAFLVVSLSFICTKLFVKPLPATAELQAQSFPEAHSATPATTASAKQTTPNPSVASPSPSLTQSPSIAPSPAKMAGNENLSVPPSIGQLVVVIASGSAAEISFYELEKGSWSLRLETEGCVGRKGIVDANDKKEGDMKTPEGLYSLGFAFGTEKPETLMDFRPITKDSYWVDDPGSQYYNTWQEGKNSWKSAERLSEDINTYHYAVVIDYNTQCVPGKGSAIFLHCKIKGYTSGCVAVPEKAMLEILGMLDPARNPSIVIAGSAEAVDGYGLVRLR